MKQILLRVPDDLHRKLAARATRSGKSANAVANEILDAAMDADQGDRKERLRARATTLGVFASAEVPPVRGSKRKRILASTSDLGPLVDRLLAEDRGRV